jgi:circadian clock protein KaiC
MDTWLLLRDIEVGGERNRGLYILKSRGMAHSNQIREFLLTDTGIDLVDVYLGPAGVLTGAARISQEAKEKVAEIIRIEEIERKKRELERKRVVIESQVTALRSEFEAAQDEVNTLTQQEEMQDKVLAGDRTEMRRLRKADVSMKNQF